MLGGTEGTWKRGRPKRRRLDNTKDGPLLTFKVRYIWPEKEKNRGQNNELLLSLLYGLDGLNDYRVHDDEDPLIKFYQTLMQIWPIIIVVTSKMICNYLAYYSLFNAS